ncbi:MAG: hypothetical protein IIX61_01765, partial [Loktanella sp.]|nr:hypothetical protein [Loktanella sp.]
MPKHTPAVLFVHKQNSRFFNPRSRQYHLFLRGNVLKIGELCRLHCVKYSDKIKEIVAIRREKHAQV